MAKKPKPAARRPPAGGRKDNDAVPPPAPAPEPPRKPSFYEAVAIYERAVRGLQRHDFQLAADNFRTVIERYPTERELVERARLYLRVCERETSQRAPEPRTPQERVYAATIALNAGDPDGALANLRRALQDDPANDHAHYIFGVALCTRGQTAEALEHLKRAIELNPENRSLARQDADLDGLREAPEFQALLDHHSPVPRRPRARN